MFERYTERARRTLFFARYEASELGQRSIEAEHLLLGLLREGKGLTFKILEKAQISYDAARSAMLTTGERFPTSVEIPFSEATKRVLQLAASEADFMDHNYIGTEHLLLGILAEETSEAAAILTKHGLTLEGVRTEIIDLLNEPPPAPSGK
jgi:ATP-dependent Clp protease ATP-binding subunit ClpC